MTMQETAQPKILFQTLVLLIGVSVIGSNAFLMSPVLNDISLSLNATIEQIAWGAAAYGGATAASGLFLTGIPARIGYRSTLLLSGSGLALGIMATGLADHWTILILAQILAGLSAGVMLPTLYAMTSVLAPPGQESAILGRVISGWSLAMVAGVPFSAFVSDLFSWRYAYFAVAAFAAIGLVGFSLLPQGSADKRSTSILKALKVPKAKPVLVITFLYMVSFYGVYTLTGTHIQLDLGRSASSAGLAVLAYGVGFGLAGVFFGKLLDRFTPIRLIGPILLVIAAIYGSFFFLAQDFTTFLLGCGIWGFANQVGLNCMVSILSQLDKKQRIRLMGIYSAVAYGGSMVAGLTFGAMFEKGGYELLLLTAVILCFLAFSIVVTCRLSAHNSTG